MAERSAKEYPIEKDGKFATHHTKIGEEIYTFKDSNGAIYQTDIASEAVALMM